MAIKSTASNPVSPAKLEQAKKGLSSLSNLVDYNPHRAEFDNLHLTLVKNGLQETAENENAMKDAFDKAHDEHVAAQWAAWNFYQGAGESVMGQYGTNSNEYASLGYKKKSEYKRTAPGSKKKKKAAAKTAGSE